jgi:hypothetical protein
MKKIFLSVCLSVIAGTFLFVSPASATRSINVDGALDPIFDEDNIYPGFSTDDTVTIENTGTETVDVYFRFNLDDGSDLADQLKLYVIRTDNDSYRLGGEGDRMTLEDADDEGALFIDRLNVGQNEEYEIKITFNKNAGNEYQEKSAEFDLELGYETEPATGSPPFRAGFTGQMPTEEVAGVSVPEEGVGGEETAALAGAESTCQSWPKWVWILSLLAFVAVLWKYLRKNYKIEKMAWKFCLVWTAAAIVFWYFFDKCREFQWFLYGAIIIVIVSYFFYLWKLKKKVKGGVVPVDSATDKEIDV